MKPTLMAIAAFVAVALGHGPVTTSSPSSTPAMTRATGKRDEPSQTSEVSTPAAPQIDNIFEIFDVFPEDILTEVLTGTVSTDSVTASSTGASATGTSDSSPTGLPNPASDSVWEDAASHGCRLFDAIRDSEEVAGQLYNPTKDSLQSILMSYESDFQGWGWNSDEIVGANFTDIDGGKKEPDPGWGIGDALRALGVSDKIVSQGGKNHVVDAIHGKAPFTQSYTKNGKTYPQTGAVFKLGVNVDEGVLMALDRISPSSAGKKRNPPVSSDQLPDLSTFSDIGYLNYKHILGKDPSDFRYLMSLMITNEKTKSIIVKALQSTGKELGPWPGETFTWDSREFKALLGSPNGMGFGYLLVQHKSQLSDVVIDKVQVFAGDTWHQLPNMVFHLKHFDGSNPPNKISGQPPKMEETSAPSRRRRGEASAVETKIHVRDANHFVRAHIMHVEL